MITTSKSTRRRSQYIFKPIKTSDEYSTLTKGKLPQGVSVKSFASDDGLWQYSVAVYAPSLEAAARQAANEMSGVQSSTINGMNRFGRKIRAGGLNEKAANQKASGKAASEEELMLAPIVALHWWLWPP